MDKPKQKGMDFDELETRLDSKTISSIKDFIINEYIEVVKKNIGHVKNTQEKKEEEINESDIPY